MISAPLLRVALSWRQEKKNWLQSGMREQSATENDQPWAPWRSLKSQGRPVHGHKKIPGLANTNQCNCGATQTVPYQLECPLAPNCTPNDISQPIDAVLNCAKYLSIWLTRIRRSFSVAMRKHTIAARTLKPQSCPSCHPSDLTCRLEPLTVVIKSLCSNLDMCLNYHTSAYFLSQKSARVICSQPLERCFQKRTFRSQI